MIRCSVFTLPTIVVSFIGCTTPAVRESTPITPESAPTLIADSVYSPISSSVEAATSVREKLEIIRGGLCNGIQPRVSVKRSFTYTPPNTEGLPADEALRWRTVHLDGARRFLKNDFFYYTGQLYRDRNQPEDIEKPLDAGALAEVDREAYKLRNFVSGPQLLQKTYAARFLKPFYFRKGGYADMQVLFRKFTFRIPLDVVNKLEETDPTQHISLPAANHYFGYNRQTFSPKLALDHQDFLWRWIAKNSTSIQEAAKDDGETKFSVEIKLDFFCQYAVSAGDLISH